MTWTEQEVRLAMAAALFGLGVLSTLSGLWTILAREYQQAMRGLSRQSTRIATETTAEKGIPETIQATANLIQAVNELVRTATGVGLMLLAIGLGICYLAYTLLP
ncbi:MAG: hypothetical protein M3220_02795 [Chloroflexota bacterium]|nr:hypothetical protein [Chloroflexota bacterium]